MTKIEELDTVKFGCFVFSLLALLFIGIPLVGFLVSSGINQQIVQPVQRQNLNHDADWLRGKTSEVTNLYHDFQNAQTAEAADVVQIHQYTKDHGDPSTWSAWDPRAQVYQQMLTKYNGDYQAEVTDAQQYNADRENPDYQTVWAQPALQGYPETLEPGPQPSL